VVGGEGVGQPQRASNKAIEPLSHAQDHLAPMTAMCPNLLMPIIEANVRFLVPKPNREGCENTEAYVSNVLFADVQQAKLGGQLCVRSNRQL